LLSKALRAEDAASKKVTGAHVEKALASMDEFTIKSSTDLSEERSSFYDVINRTVERRSATSTTRTRKGRRGEHRRSSAR